jgi:L-aspartate oxidase
VPGAPRYLLSEALRGEGARLINAQGERFVSRYDPAGDLAPRDRVARAIVLESERTGAPVYLTLAHLPQEIVRERFPAIAELCRRAGLDLATDRLPVGPAAHYLMGGVVTDLDGRSSIRGLYAAGEVARTGVHGANRLASNSLLEGLVFGGRAGRAMRVWNGRDWPVETTPVFADPPPTGAPLSVPTTEAAIRDLMWRRAGVFRDRDGLAEALATLVAAGEVVDRQRGAGASLDVSTWRVVSLLTMGTLIVRAALGREESRGAHSRTDFPERDDLHWKRRCDDYRGAR